MVLTLGRMPATCALTVLAALAASCGSVDDGDGADGSTTIVATTSVWADIVAGITCRGDVGGIEVASLIPARADPHRFEPSLQDRELLDDAALVVANGAGLESSTAAELLDSVAPDRLVEVAELPGLALRAGDEEAHVEDEEAHAEDEPHDEHGDVDPHLWLDPSLVADAIDPIADRIVASTGADAGAIGECADAYRSELLALDEEIDVLIDDVPAPRRVLVTNHDAYGYFADRYGLEVVGTVIPSTSTLAETNAAALADLADVIERKQVPAIFVDSDQDTAEADELAATLDVEVVGLRTDSLGNDDATDSYVDLLRTDAAAVADALAG